MSENSSIEWTDHTWNPWWGCTKWSAGCTHCYADSLSRRYGFDVWGPRADRRFFGDKHWAEPLKWNRDAVKAGVRRRVFCASMADVFEHHMVEETNVKMDEARTRLWAMVDATPMLDWLLLTKRPENIRLMGPYEWWVRPRPNVWYGTSVEDQEQADKRIKYLLEVPAAIRFLSCEPLLGPVNLDQACRHANGLRRPNWGLEINWVISGGESGAGARPCNPDWVRDLRDQCEAAGTAYFFKQWGGRIAKSGGRELDGRIWNEFPS